MPGKALILPPLRRTAADAARFAAIVHEGQEDKTGRPYAEHLARVARKVLFLSEGCLFWSDVERDEAVQIAWLHHVVEDTSHDWKALVAEGFSHGVASAVAKLTRDQGAPAGQLIPYADWIAGLVADASIPIGGVWLPAILVTLADVEDNTDPERLALLPEADRDRSNRQYAGAANTLRAAAKVKSWQG